MGILKLLGIKAPASKKNRRKWIRRGKRNYLVPSDEARDDEASIHSLAVHHAGSLPHPALPSQDVELRIVYHARSQLVDIECEAIGERPAGFSGRRRDLHGMIETIADALENAWYQNDNQVARLVIERVLD